jgi:hypothetical protein
VRRQGDTWKYLPPLAVDPENPSVVEQMVKDFTREGIRAFNTKLRMVAPEECFQTVINDRTHTILLIAQDKLAIDDKMLESAERLHADAMKRVIGLKRMATDDLSSIYHPRKTR